ncbi:cytochrome p450 83b1-like protein, partial [Trifolium pratense]
KALDEFFEEVLKEHLDSNNRKKEEEKDIVDVLLELRKQGGLSIDLTNDHIKAVLMAVETSFAFPGTKSGRVRIFPNLLVAASDTSAATSVWVMTGLMKNPRAMKKVQEEVRNICGKKEFIDEDDIQKLVYLKAVIKETLRYYAPAPLAPRETSKSFILNGYKIEPKTLVA